MKVAVVVEDFLLMERDLLRARETARATGLEVVLVMECQGS